MGERKSLRDARFVALAPTLSSTIAQRYVLMHYGLGEPRLAALAHTATIDIAKLIAEFPEEWAEFMRGDEPSDDDFLEFLKETVDVMGTEDFFWRGSSPWVLKHRQDDEFDARVRV